MTYDFSAKPVTEATSDKPQQPFVVIMLNIISALALIGGFILASKTSYDVWIMAGFIQYALFAALAKIVSYLSQIEINTRKDTTPPRLE